MHGEAGIVGGSLHPAGLPPVGTLVGGKYQLERYIAEGGMGVIALARHVELDEPVALKFLKPDILSADSSGTLASRFVREARATIKIRSEHVPRIFDVTTLETGVPYIVMELLVGEDLDVWLERQGPLPVAFVVDLILQSLEALAAAHALGMVHRDLKPANLFVAQRLDGSACVKVLDFGIAKLVDQNGTGRDHGLTGTNAVMGSPRYMSPEQMRSARDVDGRADIWAIGTTLYELLTGTAPFDGESLTQVCAAILQDEPNAMTRLRPDLPVELEAVVRRCLAKRPDDRYATVADLAVALVPFGTAPSASEVASRVARVLGSQSSPRISVSSLPSLPSLPQTGGPLTAARDTVAAPHATSSSNIGVTNTSWGAKDSRSQVGRRKVWTIATVFAALFVIGIVLGGAALFRSRGPRKDSVGGPAAPSTPPSAASAAIATEGLASSASAAALPSAPLATAAAASATGAASATAASTATAATEKPHAKGPDPRPTSTGAKPSASATSTTTTKPSPPAGSLWDDRK